MKMDMFAPSLPTLRGADLAQKQACKLLPKFRVKKFFCLQQASKESGLLFFHYPQIPLIETGGPVRLEFSQR